MEERFSFITISGNAECITKMMRHNYGCAKFDAEKDIESKGKGVGLKCTLKEPSAVGCCVGVAEGGFDGFTLRKARGRFLLQFKPTYWKQLLDGTLRKIAKTYGVRIVYATYTEDMHKAEVKMVQTDGSVSVGWKMTDKMRKERAKCIAEELKGASEDVSNDMDRFVGSDLFFTMLDKYKAMIAFL